VLKVLKVLREFQEEVEEMEELVLKVLKVLKDSREFKVHLAQYRVPQIKLFIRMRLIIQLVLVI
jgi:hypothetical protein